MTRIGARLASTAALAGIAAATAVAVVLAGGAGSRDSRDPALRQELYERGQHLYWQVRRTYPQYRPEKRVHELYYRAEDPAQVMELLALAPGMVVADLGCGTGFYTLPFAQAVAPEGAVLAVDVQETAVALLRERLGFRGCEGCAPIEISLGRVDDALLSPGSADLAFVSNLTFYVVDEILDENERWLESCYRAVKPGGRLVVVQDMSREKRGSVENITRHFQAAGFAVESSGDLPPISVFVDFRKPAEPAESPAPD